MAVFNFDDPDQYVDGSPYHEFARLRREAPFSWHIASRNTSDGFWLVTKHCDVMAISKQPDLFATNAPLLDEPLPQDLWPSFPALAMIADNLMTFNRQKHLIFRSIANTVFSSSKILLKRERIRAICNETILQASKNHRFDFATDVALKIPVEIVLGEFLGIPRFDLDKVTRCVLTINAMDDTVFRTDGKSFFEAADELFDYGTKLMRKLKARPSDSLLSELIHSTEIAGSSEEQLFLTYWFPLTAGAFDTTASVIAGGVHALLSFPRQLDQLRQDASAIPTTVDEMVRWVSPVIYFRRTATSDAEFNGNRIRDGQRIILCYASANRDEDVFVNPDSFEVKRSPNNHISFGYGSHFCLGARLALLIVRVFLEEFLAHMPEIEIDGAIVRTRSAWMNRIRYMPVQRLSCRA